MTCFNNHKLKLVSHHPESLTTLASQFDGIEVDNTVMVVWPTTQTFIGKESVLRDFFLAECKIAKISMRIAKELFETYCRPEDEETDIGLYLLHNDGSFDCCA